MSLVKNYTLTLKRAPHSLYCILKQHHGAGLAGRYYIFYSIAKISYTDLEKCFKRKNIMEPLEDVLQDGNFMSQLMPVSLYDLLSRDSKTLDKKYIPYFIEENRVLITGAGEYWQ